MSFHEAHATAAAGEDGRSKSDAPIEYAQATDQPWDLPAAGAPDGFPAQFGLPPAPRPPGPFGPFRFARPAGPPPAPRVACEEEVDRFMGLTGYLKSKLHLQADQRAAWQKVEQAAAPGVEKIRDQCGRLPSRPAPPPGVLERLDFAEQQMTARVELLRAVHEPLQALFEMLSPDQRTILAIMPPVHPMPPAPPMPARPERGL